MGRDCTHYFCMTVRVINNLWLLNFEAGRRGVAKSCGQNSERASRMLHSNFKLRKAAIIGSFKASLALSTYSPLTTVTSIFASI